MKKNAVFCVAFVIMISCMMGCSKPKDVTDVSTVEGIGQQGEEGVEPAEAQTEDVVTEEVETSEGTEAADYITVKPEEPEATSIPEVTAEPESVSITITATGDCTLGTTQLQSYSNSFDEVYDENQGAEYFFDNVRDIFEQDDLTIVNLECSLTTSTDLQEKEWNLKGKPEYIDILTCSSIEAVSMGNNHRLDYGEDGLKETVQLLEDAKIAYSYDDIVGRYETKGITIGIVSVNEHYDGKLVEVYLQEGITKLQEEDTDLIIACCHWGTEGSHRTGDYQEELGNKCVDWGADLVIGNHPHVLQGVNVYQGKYIIYSLGNFCFGGNRNPKDKDTMIFQQTFTFADGELIADNNVRIIPCSISSVKSKNNYQPTPATGSEAERIMKDVNSYCEDYNLEFGMDGYLQ